MITFYSKMIQLYIEEAVQMSGEKRFGSSVLGGFAKSDVNAYIERMLKEFDERLKQKDNEISMLKNQNRELRIKYEDIERRMGQVNEDRVKIADAIIIAKEKAESVIEEARKEALEEKKKLEQTIESEKEKLVDVKRELKSLKTEVIQRLKKFEQQITEVIDDEAEEDN
jgi:cell division initiation protein